MESLIGPKVAQWPGNCYQCGGVIYVGDHIYTQELPLGKLVAYHKDCAEQEECYDQS